MTPPEPAPDPIAQAAHETADELRYSECAHAIGYGRVKGECSQCLDTVLAAFGRAQRAEGIDFAIEMAGVFRGCGDHVHAREDRPHCTNNSAVVDKLMAALRASGAGESDARS